MASTAGRLLVASPLIGDPNFERSVVLMLEHDANGALGLVLDRPSDTPVAEILPQWAPSATRPDHFFIGGPVAPETVIALGRSLTNDPGFVRFVENVGTLDLDGDPDQVADDLVALRLFAGYSGWGPGQLESELAVDAWFVVDADPNDAFSAQPDELWSFVLRRQAGPMAWLANYPLDPSLN